MSTIIVATILVGSIAAIFIFLIKINNKQNREAMNKLLGHFNLSLAESGLSISSQEILKGGIFGIDGTRRKILTVTKENGSFHSDIIDLKQIKTCNVKKVYGTIQAGDLETNKLENFLEKIILQFEADNTPGSEIVFYKHGFNHIYDTLEMEKKAKEWQVVLSKMISPLKKIA